MIFRLWITLSLTAMAMAKSDQNQLKKPPHIILILADDLGWNDVGFHGTKDISTPNIDALAADSTILNNYYVQPLCTPSRAALMTGLYPSHTGTQHYVIRTAEGWGLPLHLQTLPQQLNKLKYDSRIVGKWHLGYHRTSYTPLARGFHSHYGFWPGAMDFYTHRATTLVRFNDTKNYPYEDPRDAIVFNGKSMRDNLIAVDDREGDYLTHILNEKALELIRNHNQSKPLFLYLAHHAVHRGNHLKPVQGPPGTDEDFKSIENETRRNFAGVVKALDDSIGDVIEALKERGMLQNSIVVLSTDNGAEVTTMFPSGGSNYPLRGQKYTPWEGGIKGVAMIWSPMLGKPKIYKHLFSIVDWMPTLYRAAGGNPVHLGPIDGIDMWDALKFNQPSPRQEILHYLDPVWHIASIRESNYKLVCGSSPHADVNGWYDVVRDNATFDSNEEESKVSKVLKEVREELGTEDDFEINRESFPLTVNCGGETTNVSHTCFPKENPCLFDIETDPCEIRNVADQYPQIVERLLVRLRYHQSTSVPIRNQPSDYVANPSFHNGFWSSWADLQDTLKNLLEGKANNDSDIVRKHQLAITTESIRQQVEFLQIVSNSTLKNHSTILEEYRIKATLVIGLGLLMTLYKLSL